MKVGAYQLIAEIKRGEHGVTYRGWDAQNQCVVLLKTFKAAEPFARAGGAPRFAREAEVYTRIDHPNVVKLRDYGFDAGVCFIALEFVEGNDLRRILQKFSRHGVLPVEIAVAVFYEALQGLAEIHRQGIIHRDLKPENLLLCHDGRVKICDFDLSLSAEENEPNTGVTGSPGYVAPEVILGEKISPAADLFSLAVVFYEMLAGVRPFQAATPGGEMNAIVRLAHLPLQKVAAGAPAQLEQLLDRMLAKRPHERAASASTALEWLDHHFVLGSTATRAQRIQTFLAAPEDYPEVGLTPRARATQNGGISRIRRRIFAASMAAMLVLLAGWHYWRAQSPAPAETQIAQTNPTPQSSVDSSSVLKSFKPEENPEKARELLRAPENLKAPPESTSAEIVAAQPRERTILIRSNPWAYLFLNGDSMGLTPFAITLRANTATHEILFKNPQFPAVRTAVPFNTQTSDTLSVSLWDHVAQLELHVTPWAEIYINDVKRAPIEGEKTVVLLPGKYRLRFVHSQLGEKTETILLRAGEIRQLAINMF